MEATDSLIICQSDGVLSEILSHLPIRDLWNTARSCRQMRAVAIQVRNMKRYRRVSATHTIIGKKDLSGLTRTQLMRVIGALSRQFDSDLTERGEDPDRLRGWFHVCSVENHYPVDTVDRYFGTFDDVPRFRAEYGPGKLTPSGYSYSQMLNEGNDFPYQYGWYTIDPDYREMLVSQRYSFLENIWHGPDPECIRNLVWYKPEGMNVQNADDYGHRLNSIMHSKGVPVSKSECYVVTLNVATRHFPGNFRYTETDATFKTITTAFVFVYRNEEKRPECRVATSKYERRTDFRDRWNRVRDIVWHEPILDEMSFTINELIRWNLGFIEKIGADFGYHTLLRALRRTATYLP